MNVLKTVLDQFICCPVDHTYPLQMENAEYEGDAIITATLRCPTCETSFPVTDGIPHLLPPRAAQDRVAAAAKEREAAARDADAAGYDARFPTYVTATEQSALLNPLHVQPGDVVLELGAGTGRTTTRLARAGATVIACDISTASLAINRAKCAAISGAVVHYIVCDACYLPVREGSISKAVSAQTLEHIPTPVERQHWVDEAYRALQPGGRFTFTAYNYPWTHRRRHATQEGYHGKDLYFYRFQQRELRNMLHRYRTHTLTAVVNLPRGVRSRPIELLISAIPPLAGLTGNLLFAHVERKA